MAGERSSRVWTFRCTYLKGGVIIGLLCSRPVSSGQSTQGVGSVVLELSFLLVSHVQEVPSNGFGRPVELIGIEYR